jgi:hypothetical protein
MGDEKDVQEFNRKPEKVDNDNNHCALKELISPESAS